MRTGFFSAGIKTVIGTLDFPFCPAQSFSIARIETLNPVKAVAPSPVGSRSLKTICSWLNQELPSFSHWVVQLFLLEIAIFALV